MTHLLEITEGLAARTAMLADAIPVLLADVKEAQRWLLGDLRTVILLVLVLVFLGIAYGVGRMMVRQTDTVVNPAVAQMFLRRVQFWWLMAAVLAAAFTFYYYYVTVLLFFAISFWALREFITLTPTRLGDHRALFWVFFVFTPMQYLLVGLGSDYYEFFTILIPVYGILFIPARIALAGDYHRFLERVAKIQAALILCVYALSYAPALLYLKLQSYDSISGKWRDWDGSPAGVLLYFFLVAQLFEVFQYICDKLRGEKVIAPTINANRTWEGFFGGFLSTIVVGAFLCWVTPFGIMQSALMAGVIAIMTFSGGLAMSAIKRDRGVADYGTLVEGHAGILDRIDGICFAAPVFYHLTRFFFTGHAT